MTRPSFLFIRHGETDWNAEGRLQGGQDAARSVRFFVVSMVSLGLNELWIWILTGWLHGDKWWPIPAMVFVTPAVVFVLNRKWVFA